MENNFYRERPVPGRSGVVEGDAGKLEMYVSGDAELGGAKFACKPFDELFWGLWKPFRVCLVQMRSDTQWRDPGE